MRLGLLTKERLAMVMPYCGGAICLRRMIYASESLMSDEKFLMRFAEPAALRW